MNAVIKPVAFAAKEVLGAEKGMVTRAYSALVAVELRIGAFAERGRAVKLADELAVEFARLRAGDKAWAAQDETGRAVAVRACTSSAKRYADKAVGIAKQAAQKGAPVREILNAETDADAQALVKAWFVTLKCVSMDTLFETFGYAKPTADKKPKEADAKAPSAGETSTPEAAPTPEAPRAQAPDNAAKVGNVDDFLAITRAVMGNWTEEQRLEYARAMLPELLAMARTAPALTA
jgi:hypothetical protein